MWYASVLFRLLPAPCLAVGHRRPAQLVLLAAERPRFNGITSTLPFTPTTSGASHRFTISQRPLPPGTPAPGFKCIFRRLSAPAAWRRFTRPCVGPFVLQGSRLLRAAARPTRTGPTVNRTAIAGPSTPCVVSITRDLITFLVSASPFALLVADGNLTVTSSVTVDCPAAAADAADSVVFLITTRLSHHIVSSGCTSTLPAAPPRKAPVGLRGITPST